MKSYTAHSDNSHSVFSEFYRLWSRSRNFSPRYVTEIIEMVRKAEDSMAEVRGGPIENLDILEIGVGQLPRQLAYFGIKNRVIGIDLDVIDQGMNPLRWIKIMQQNGFVRGTKTLARKVLGFDRQFKNEMQRQLGVPKLPKVEVLQKDAANSGFEDGSFDAIYSFNVFEHLPDPAAVLDESKRILRPGGVIFAHAHLFTSDRGCHDLRTGIEGRGGLPYWAHLRPDTAHQVQPSAYINRFRLEQWNEIFAKELPGGKMEYWQPPHPKEEAELAAARQSNELKEYTDQELLTQHVVCIWQKPVATKD